MKSENMCALKEWAVVNQSLREGHQIFLLQKEGVVKQSGVWAMTEKEFFIFPVYERKSKEDLQEDYHPWMPVVELSKPPEGRLNLDVYAQVDSICRIKNIRKLNKMVPYSIWSENYMKKFFDGQSEVFLVFLRCYRGPQFFRVPFHPDYKLPCPWVELKTPLSPNSFYPVLTVDRFKERKNEILKELGSWL